MATLDDFRQLPQYKDFSDEQLVVTLSQKYGIEPGEIAQEFGVNYNSQRNPLGAGLSAGVDQLQGLGYGAIGAGARALGAEGVADWADRGVTRNYAESAFNGRSDLERIEDQSLGSALPFLGYQVAKQVPMLAGTLAASAAVPQAAIPAALSRGLAVIPKGLGGGGLKAGMDFAGRRAALEAGNAFGRTIAASYPIGVGAMYGEAVERGDPTQGDALAALGLGVPYGAAEAVMPSMVRNAFGSNAARFAGGLPTRLAKAGGLGFAGEAGTELFQNELEMGFAGNLTQDEIDSRRLNSAVIGGLVGGPFNLPAGFRGQRNPADPIDILNRDTSPQAPTAPAAGLNLTNLAVPQPGVFNDPSQVEQWAGIATAPTAEQHASRAEDILAAFNTPVGEVGGRPVTAWEAFQREQGVPANRIQTGPAQLKEAAPKIDIPVPQPLQSDPVRSAVAQASPATLRKDGSLKDIVEKALGAYSEFSDGEIAAALEEFAASKRKDTVWRVAALEAIARQRAAQGAPNVAQVDAASGQGAGAVPAGSTGNTPSGPVVLDGVRQPAGAPAPGSAARVPVGEPVVQQPSGLTEGAQPANVPPTQQVAPQATEARGQEGAATEPSEDQRLANKRAIYAAQKENGAPDDVAASFMAKLQSKANNEGVPQSVWRSKSGALGTVPASQKSPFKDGELVGVLYPENQAPTQEEVQDAPKAEQVAPQATEARGQESAQAGQSGLTDAQRTSIKETAESFAVGDSIETDDGTVVIKKVLRDRDGKVSRYEVEWDGDKYDALPNKDAQGFLNLSSMLAPQPYVDANTGERRVGSAGRVVRAAPSEPQSDEERLAAGQVRVVGGDGTVRWVTPTKAKTAAKGKRAAGERVPFEQLRGTEQQMVRDFMGYDEFGEVSEEVEPMSLRQMSSVYGVSHETLGKRLAALGYTNEVREQESAAEETFLTETAIGREDASPELSDEAIDIADVVGGNLRVQKGVGAKGDTGAGRGYQKLLAAGTRFDARRDGRPIWSEAAIAEAVASNALSDEQLVAAEKELAARAKREADERAAKQSKRVERAAPAPRTQEQIAQEGRAVSRAQNQAARDARVRAEREAAEQEVQRRVAAEAALQREYATLLAMPDARKAASYWNRFADEGAPSFDELPQELQVEWVERYTDLLAELPADARVPDAMEALQSATQQEFLNDEAYQRAVGAVGETVAGGDSTGSQNQGAEEGNRPDEVARADAREEVTSTVDSATAGFGGGTGTQAQYLTEDRSEFRGTVDGLHGASTPVLNVTDPSEVPPRLRNDAGAWSDGESDGFYFAEPEDRSWFRGSKIRMPDFRYAYEVNVRFNRAFLLTPQTLERFVEQFGTDPMGAVRAMREQGFDGVVTRGFDTDWQVMDALVEQYGLEGGAMSWGPMLMDQAVSFDPAKNVRITGRDGKLTEAIRRVTTAESRLRLLAKRAGVDLDAARVANARYNENVGTPNEEYYSSQPGAAEAIRFFARDDVVAAVAEVERANNAVLDLAEQPRGEPRFSRTSDTQGTTVEAVRSAINDIATPMGRRKVTVYQTADEAVQSGALNSKDAKGTQGWVDAKGNAFFIAGNIPNGSELAVVLHEIGAHLGIEKLLTDKQYEALVKKIFAWAQSDANTQEARIARAALARVDAAKLENEADLAPETIAYFIEEAVKAGVNPTAMQYKTELGRWFRTLWAAFKVALRRLNLINADRLTAQNVVDLAYGAANLELTGKLDGGSGGAPRASTNAFKRWFGDSKVVDAQGNPLVVYHGTAADIEFFDPLALGANTRAASAKKAFFFAASPKVASGYAVLSESRPSLKVSIIDNAAKSEVLPESLRKMLLKSINETTLSKAEHAEWDEMTSGVEFTIGANVLPVYLSMQNPLVVDYKGSDYRERSFASVVAEAKKNGHDGVIFRNAKDTIHNDFAEVSDIFAVFEPTQIKSAIGNNGNYDPTDRRIRFSKAADPQLTELAQESGQRAWAAIQAGVRKGWTGLAFSSHLANAAHRAGLTSARALELVQRKKATRAYEIQIEVEKVLSKFADLKGQINGRPASEVVQRFIYDSTFDKKWGFKPDWKQDAVVDPEMERRFNALPTEAQTVIKDVFRHGDAIFKEKQDLLRKTITGEYEALIKAETDDGKRRKLERQRDKELREAGRLIAEMNGPYAPLRRYGNYVVVAKSQKYRDAEAAGPVDAKLKRDENHYVVEFAETLYEAERLQGVLEGKFGKGMVWAGEKETATEQFGELPFMAVQRLRKMVDTDLEGDLNTKSKRVLNKLLVDLYISTLHEANARHSEQKRQFVNRADRDTAAKDLMRAFATQGRADSHLVSALQFNSEIVDEMQKLRNEAKNGQGDSLLKTRLRNEILQRHMMDLDFRETPVQDKLMSLNSFWMLLTSPGYYVQNATQVMMMTQPVLAGKFGQNRSMRQLMRGYQDAMRVLKGSSWNEAADLSRFNGTADEKAMLIELQARGTLDFGISAELGYWESRGEISKVFNQVMRKVGMGTRKLEVLNRMSSALAAYRMMYDQTTGTQAKRHAAALDYADSIIKDTHGDYSSTNAPRYLRMMPKVMTQFRKFQLIQLSLFAKVIHGSIKGANPQEKRAMRAALGYLFMNHALLAGAVGVPASALLGAIYAIAGDDDDPNDWEVDVRRAIGDKEMADLILHGLPSLININMSNKIGAGTMLDPLPFVEYEATRGGYEKAVTAAMGPLIGGLGAQVVDAFGRILKGDVAQGTAQLLPRGFRDAARGFMAAQDGIKLRNGQTALTPEELSFYDSLMMGLGLPTLKTTSRTETQFKSQQYEQFFRERVTKLKRQYSEAYEENDREAMLEARQAWAEMQASRKNLGFKVQPLSDLLKAPREKAKAEAKLQGGVRTTEQARGFVQSLQ